MKRSEGIAYLTNNGEDDHLACFSRYGRTTRECAPVAWRLAYLVARRKEALVWLAGYASGRNGR